MSDYQCDECGLRFHAVGGVLPQSNDCPKNGCCGKLHAMESAEDTVERLNAELTRLRDVLEAAKILVGWRDLTPEQFDKAMENLKNKVEVCK